MGEVTRVTSRINVFRPLNPRGLYPIFDFQVSVKGVEYDLVLSDLIADQLRDYCCRRGHYRLEREHDGETLRGIRSGVVRRTVSPSDRHRLIYAELETKAEVRVHVDKLCEAATYSYVFASIAIASNLCVDADAGKLPDELAAYVRLHNLALFGSGGFELLVARFDSLAFDEHVLSSDPPEVRELMPDGVRQRRSLLNGLLD
jgi:hypothetical protein